MIFFVYLQLNIGTTMYDCILERDQKWKDYFECYAYNAKNNVGQSMYVGINAIKGGFYDCSNNLVWSIVFYVTSKKKRGYEELKQTGKDGIKTLIWAKQCIKHFIENKCKKGDLFIVCWDDVKRKNVYAYGLKDIGFTFGTYEKKPCLLKKI